MFIPTIDNKDNVVILFRILPMVDVRYKIEQETFNENSIDISNAKIKKMRYKN